MEEPLVASEARGAPAGVALGPPPTTAARSTPPDRFRTRVIGEPERIESEELGVVPAPGTAPAGPAQIDGRVLGKFRNTYYDFPSEADFSGEPVALRNLECRPIKQVPRGFFESVCVQGSGTLLSGQTVSFGKRDCECAEQCPKTGQRICFEALDAARFPWGRGATGKPITPLLTVAVDSDVIPLGTSIYIPDFVGLPLDEARTGAHDGCFVAQDRGLRVQGQHVDVFTGHSGVTALWNGLVPSNQGVTVVLDSPSCERAPEAPPAETRKKRD
jgi:3D (Asp-Asp-Asp) domain-containing protein